LGGSSVTLQQLDNLLNPTGQTFAVTTSDNLGDFSIPPAVSSSLIEVIINGFFFDEVWSSAQPTAATFHAYADLQAAQTAATVNVNLMTHLQGTRLQTLLVDGGLSFSDAGQQSVQEVLAAFHIPAQFASDFTQATLTAGTDQSAILLAISIVMLNGGGQDGGSAAEADALEFIDQFRLTMQAGSPSSTIQTQIEQTDGTLTCAQVNNAIQRLLGYYTPLGISFPVPHAMDFIDTGWTGTINRFQDAGINTQDDPNNCGFLCNTCNGGQVCADGGCSCPFAGANQEQLCDGGCADLQADTNNCGGCGIACSSVEICDAGACVCPTAALPDYCAASNRCVDQLNDPNNCGSCGNVCSQYGVGPCINGSCLTCGSCSGPGQYCILVGDAGVCETLVTLASQQAEPGLIAVDSNYVYWIDYCGGDVGSFGCEGTISKVPLTGGQPVQLATGQLLPSGLVVGRDNVYWSVPFYSQYSPADAGRVLMVPSDGGNPTILWTAPGQNSPSSLTTDGTNLYWSTSGSSSTSDYSIMSLPLDGNSDAGPQVLCDLCSASAMVVSQNNLSWVNGIESVSTLDLQGDGGPQLVGSTQDGPLQQIAADGQNLYFTDLNDYGLPFDLQATGSVMIVPTVGGTPAALATAQAQPYGIVVDGDNLYWANGGVASLLDDCNNGTIMRLSLDSGVLTQLASGQSSPAALAVDDTSLYWINQASSSSNGSYCIAASNSGSVEKLTPK
jgi:hypothetical protein